VLRARDSYEFKDIGLRLLDPDARVYELVEQVFELPLWSIRALPLAADDSRDRRWVRFLTASTEALLSIVRARGWEELDIHALLPAYMATDGEMRLASCQSIWEAHVVDDPLRATWVFETDQGNYVDPECEWSLDDVERSACLWSTSRAAEVRSRLLPSSVLPNHISAPTIDRGR